jgi:hypothetical protein
MSFWHVLSINSFYFPSISISINTHNTPHFNLHTQSINFTTIHQHLDRSTQVRLFLVSAAPTLSFVAGWSHASPLGIIQWTFEGGAISD